MRREVKYPVVGFTAGFVIGGFADFIIQAIRLDRKNEFDLSKIDWWHCFKIALSFGSVGAIAGYGIYRWRLHLESTVPFDSDRFLSQLLSNNSIKSDPTLYSQADKERYGIKQLICQSFQGQIINGKPINWGSTAKGTAIGNRCDFDIIIPFSKNSFASLEEMYNSVYDILHRNYSSVNCDVRKQRRSIGITFHFGEKNLHFDVVPGREINDYRTDGELNLFEKNRNCWSKPTRIKTNVRTHRQQTVNRPEERKVIKLVKLYRDCNRLNISSSAIQHLVLDCFDEQFASQSISENFLLSLDYISRVIPDAEIIDPANSNNKISSGLSASDRYEISSRINRDLNALNSNELYLKEIFH